VIADREAALRSGDLDGSEVPSLADGSDFYADPELSYGFAAAACTYLVATRGPDVLWDLMDAFAEEQQRAGSGAGLTTQAADALLVREIGLDNAGLTIAALRWSAGAG